MTEGESEQGEGKGRQKEMGSKNQAHPLDAHLKKSRVWLDVIGGSHDKEDTTLLLKKSLFQIGFLSGKGLPLGK